MKKEENNDGEQRVPAVAYFDEDFAWEELAETAAPQLAAIPTLDASESESLTQASAADAWERFYHLHARSATVYKPRRYITSALPELLSTGPEMGAESPTLLEVGCGLGSSLATILEGNPAMRCFACDLSPMALQLLRTKLPAEHADRVHAFRCDIVREPAVLEAAVGGAGALTFALLVFTLSAMEQRHHATTLRHLRHVMRPGGLLLFRDYGLYDISQLRSRRRLDDRLFARQDGTLAFFFTPEYLAQLLAESGGWEVVENKYACVRNVNRATGQVMHRVFVHAKARAREERRGREGKRHEGT